MRVTIEKKLGLSFAAVFGLSIIVCCISYAKLTHFSSLQDYTATVQLPIFAGAYDVRVANQQTGALLGEYVMLEGDEKGRERVKRDWEQTWERLNDDVSKLQNVPYKRSENRQRAQQLATLFPEYRRAQQKVLDEISTGNQGKQLAFATFRNEVAPRSEEIRKLAKATVESVADVMTEADQTVDAAANQTKWTLVLGSVISILVGSLLLVIVSGRIVRSLKLVVSRANEIAAGDLSGQALNQTSNDEIADLTVAVNRMQDHLVGVLQKIGQNAETVASASEEISANATQSAKGSQAQSDQTTQVATAVQQMSATVVEISDNSSRAADAAQKAVETAKRGGIVVEESLTSMRAIAASVVESAKRIEDLGKSSDQIGKIIAVIDDIADQTNLLALNAAIEAARAGDQGRGFAVVADEVRKLAERTTTATKEIAQMIETVQHETRLAVDHMNAGTKQVERGVQTTTQSGDALLAIIQEAEQVGDMVAQIASAATEQASTTEQIRVNVGSIAKITHESAVGAQQSAQACEELSQLAMTLQQLASNFKLAHSASPQLPAGTRNATENRHVLHSSLVTGRYSSVESLRVQ